MENILSQNVRRICKERKIQLKELAWRMGVDPAALTITPVSLNNVSGNNSVSFQAYRKKSDNVQPEQSQSSSNLAKVPVIVMLAMSPLTSANTNAKVPVMPESPRIEVVAPPQTTKKQSSKKVELSLIKEENYEAGYEKMKFLYGDADNDKRRAEALAVEYSYLSEGGYEGLMDFTVKMISPLPNKNGRYYIAYQEIKNGEAEELRVCTIRKEFAKAMLNFVSSSFNHDAVKYDGDASLYKAFRGKSPKLEDEVRVIRDIHSGKFFKCKRESEYPNYKFE